MWTAIITTFWLSAAPAGSPPALIAGLDTGHIDRAVGQLMARHDVPGLALALIEGGEVSYVHAYGYANLETMTDLETDHVLYGASWTKTLFSILVMKEVAEGRLNLDTPVEQYLERPLPTYQRFADLADEPRWRQLTLRMLLGHTTGFPNYRFFPPWSDFDPDAKLAFFRDPGVGYGYSGEGYYIAQQVMDDHLGRESGAVMMETLLRPAGMISTALMRDERLVPRLARTYNRDGKPRRRGMASDFAAAGSMDTTITDMAHFMAAFMRGDILKPAAMDDMLKPHIAIKSAHQFPPWHPKTDERNALVKLSAGVGVVLFQGSRGPAFAKGGHDDGTDNMMLCLLDEQTCLLAMMTTAKGDLVYPVLFDRILKGNGFPWRWEYGNFTDHADQP